MRRETVTFFVGPAGSSDERAAKLFNDISSEEVLPVLTTKHLVSTVDMTPGALGVLPLEDSIRGEFRGTYDALIENVVASRIVSTTVLKEEIGLYVIDANWKITTILSHLDILSKYGDMFLETGIESLPSVNSSVACEEVRRRGNPSFGALAPKVVAESYGLVPSAVMKIERVDVSTRYGLLGRAQAATGDSDGFVSMLYLEPREDRSGTLSEILEVFRKGEINLTRLRSQNRGYGVPHGFVVELEGNVDSGAEKNCVENILALGVGVKILGVFTADQKNGSPEKNVVPAGVMFDDRK